MWQEGLIQFQTTVGSSPATYGLAAFAIAKLPASQPVGTAFCGLPFWSVCGLVALVPNFFRDTYGINVANAPVSRVVGAAIAITLICCGVLPVIVGEGAWILPGEGASVYFAWYLLSKNLDHFIANMIGAGGSGADDSCHLGGAATGLFIALTTATIAASLEPENNPWSSKFWWSQRGLLVVVIMGELTRRVAKGVNLIAEKTAEARIHSLEGKVEKMANLNKELEARCKVLEEKMEAAMLGQLQEGKEIKQTKQTRIKQGRSNPGA